MFENCFDYGVFHSSRESPTLIPQVYQITQVLGDVLAEIYEDASWYVAVPGCNSGAYLFDDFSYGFFVLWLKSETMLDVAVWSLCCVTYVKLLLDVLSNVRKVGVE